MTNLLSFLLIGVTTGAVYAISATGLVVTYVTSRTFNFAHGAVGMFCAFVYYTLRVERGWPAPVALVVVVLVIAPAVGVLLDVVVMRGLQGTSTATKITVTLALLVAVQGLARAIYGVEFRPFPGFFGDAGFRLFGVFVAWDDATTILVGAVVAVLLRLVFRRTRIGVAMRAVVDNPELAALKGMNPNVVTAVSWAVGSSLAGLAAILIAAGQNLDIRVLSLLVVTAYAAAVVGRLQSVPLTYVGAMALGISEALVVGYLPQDNEFVRTLRPSLPFLLLFVMLLVRRDTQLPERVQAVAQGRPPGPATACACAAVGVAAAALAAPHLSPARLVIGSSGLVFALLALSLVLLTGFSGQVSLTQLGFAGLGAVTMGRLAGQVPPLLALAAAGCLAAVVGAVVALPALRLQGIYLALSTLAFALMLDYMVFDSQAVMGPRISLTVPRPSLFGISLAGERAMFVFLAAVCAAASVLVVAIRRGPFGRLLTALRDAPVAVATLGANPVGIKVKVFTLSAFLAGVAGALLGGLQSKVSPIDFVYFRSLTLILVVTTFGIASVGGALAGALFFVVLPEFTGGRNSEAVQALTIGLAAIALARHPEGLVGAAAARARSALDGLARFVGRVRAVGRPVAERVRDAGVAP